ncbi:MAG: 3-phosphoserine/phosphohydroxythreonine transaminase [Clostridiales Family XIII bacterium]|jgi:phosphoserine aminotransferase|nr:3-phosphoserine/phosphohydroxythreonine transaminase [Clostridiales Family XIII bacterium]
MTRIYNFSAGPSVLPEPVLRRAAAEMMDYNGSGMSVMEMSHRSKVFEEIIVNARALFRRVMDIPDDYAVLFLQGGATLQFAMAPANLLTGSGKADYVLTGNFATNAYKEALLFEAYGKEINVAGSTKDENFTRIPTQDELTFTPGADYAHICANNTVYGSKWNYIPDTGGAPLVADISSCILSEPIDVTKYGIAYAGAQKNIAPAGLTIVIARRGLLTDPLPGTPTMMNYKKLAEKDSLYNTPPCWQIYIAMLVLELIESEGGLTVMQRRNIEKAKMLYDYLDSTDFYEAPVAKDCRSLMNVVFHTRGGGLDAAFIEGSAKAGMTNLKGHRSVGGMRASIYNAMPKEGVGHLVNYMKEFERKHG